MNSQRFVKIAVLCAAASVLVACTSSPKPEAGGEAVNKWSALGWLNPSQSGEPEVIGLYPTEAECRAAVDYWMSRQVVGNPITGDCLPVDRK